MLHVPHRGSVLCQTAQHEADMVCVQLFQPTAHYFDRLIISGNPQHLAFGGASVYKQVHDLIDGVLIIRAEPEQQFDLQCLIKIIFSLSVSSGRKGWFLSVLFLSVLLDCDFGRT